MCILQEQRFVQKQQQELNEALQKAVQEHKRKVASMEWDVTVKSQQLKRGTGPSPNTKHSHLKSFGTEIHVFDSFTQ